MYLIVGLGNPESDYSGTRHNMGFDVINEISKKLNIEVNKTKFKALYGTGVINNEKIVLIKPQTFMNLSGESLILWKNFYKLDNQNIIVISDDIDLEPGNIRIKRKGSAGSHNGLKSIIKVLDSEEFLRVRVGIGKPENKEDLIEYVIGYVDKDEKEILKKGVEKAANSVISIVEDGVEKTMNLYN